MYILALLCPIFNKPKLLHTQATLFNPSFVSLLPATDERSDNVREVVPLLFTLLPSAVTQNFSLHNANDSIYG